jgi:hypothetical protein
MMLKFFQTHGRRKRADTMGSCHLDRTVSVLSVYFVGNPHLCLSVSICGSKGLA